MKVHPVESWHYSSDIYASTGNRGLTLNSFKPKYMKPKSKYHVYCICNVNCICQQIQKEKENSQNAKALLSHLLRTSY